MAWSGTIYDAGTLTVDGDSGWFDVRDRFEGRRPNTIARAWLHMVPADLAATETLDLDLNVAFDADGTGDVKIHDFTQVVAVEVNEDVHIPGTESVSDVISSVINPGRIHTAGIPPFWKFTWDVGGLPGPSLTFVVYGILIGGFR